MSSSISKLAAVLLGAAVLGASAAAPVRAEMVKLTILGVGDIYNFEGPKDRGGFARLNAVAKAEKANNPNTIYVFDGDMLSPSLLSGFDKGANTIELTNLVPFDIAVPGNHEFDFGTDNFLDKMKMSKYPWAAINLTHVDGSPIDGLGGTMVKDIGGLKVALVPVAQDTTPQVSSPGDWKFGDTVKTAIDGAKAARADGADLVIGVIQGDHEYDREIMASHAFDVIISGDDHDYMTGYDGITAYVETSTEAKYLSPLDLEIMVTEKDGKRSVSWEPSFRFIDTKTVVPDPDTQKIVDDFKTKLDTSLNVEIGATVGPLDSRRNVVRSEEAAIGNLIADAMRGANGADVAITNGGGIRADRQYDAGTVLTRRDILTELPFGNVTVVTEVTGQQLIDALENGFSQVEDGAGRFPQVSGLTVVADLKQPAGSRVVSVMVGNEPLDMAATYQVATNDFMLNGGDGYTALAGGKVLIGARGGKLMASDVIDYIAAAGKVDAKVEGRITFE
jgi:2',3'-cyclic-nucleotide 2'-phosphodiesterase (5'-nucleotidase family)